MIRRKISSHVGYFRGRGGGREGEGEEGGEEAGRQILTDRQADGRTDRDRKRMTFKLCACTIQWELWFYLFHLSPRQPKRKILWRGNFSNCARRAARNSFLCLSRIFKIEKLNIFHAFLTAKIRRRRQQVIDLSHRFVVRFFYSSQKYTYTKPVFKLYIITSMQNKLSTHF